MSANGRYADVKFTMEQGSPEIQILFDRPKAASLASAGAMKWPTWL
ncbi:MAG: hypothetical protein U5K69_24255 [Balneolaceae bacterium]|nr:hypothetical protein [Balneolaceae bacterium]